LKFSTADGRKVGYRQIGSGPKLVCHPGGPGFSSLYFADLAGLWERFTLVLLNPRGTADSDRPSESGSYAIDDYVDDVESLRLHLGEERLMLLGHSHGGVVAQTYAARYPGRLRKLVLASTLARFAPEQDAAMHAGMEKRSHEPWYPDAAAALEAEQAGNFSDDVQLSDLVFKELPLYFARFGPMEAGYLETLRTEALNGDALLLFNREIFTNFDLRPEHARIKAPTLVITGSDDFICGPLCADEMAAGIAGSTKVVVGDAGHMVFVEQPVAFHREVADFLTS
jgi:proline-specific peptidase